MAEAVGCPALQAPVDAAPAYHAAPPPSTLAAVRISAAHTAETRQLPWRVAAARVRPIASSGGLVPCPCFDLALAR